MIKKCKLIFGFNRTERAGGLEIQAIGSFGICILRNGFGNNFGWGLGEANAVRKSGGHAGGCVVVSVVLSCCREVTSRSRRGAQRALLSSKC